jgi:hypothetical protein
MAGDTKVCVHTVWGEFAAQQVKAFLLAHDVRCELRGEAVRNTHGLTLDGLGEVRIFVAERDADRARDLLEQVESGAWKLEEVPGEATEDRAAPREPE